MSVSILLEGGKDQARIWKKEMALVVRERNALVHKMLSHFDPYSLASCETLSAALDEQRERITPAFLQLEALVVAMRELHNGESLQANCLNGLDAHGEA